MSIPSSSEAVATSAFSSPARSRRLDPQAAVLREAPVVGGDHVVAEPLAQLVGQPLGQPAGVDEHDRGAVAGDLLGDPVEHVGHLRRGGDGLQLAVGQLEGDVERPPVARVDDRAVRAASGPRRGRRPAGRRPPRCGFCVADSPTRAGATAQTWASRSSVRHRWLPRLSRARAWISSTITVSTSRSVARLRVGRDEQVERLGRGDHERARRADHRRPLAGRGVAGADADGELGRRQPEPPRRGGDLGQRPLEVLGDVDGQGLQRRDVDHPRAGDRLAPGEGEVEAVDGHEEAGQRLARAGGRGDEGVLAGRDRRPGRLLGGRGPLGEAVPEPGRHRRVQLHRRAPARCRRRWRPARAASNSDACVGADTPPP